MPVKNALTLVNMFMYDESAFCVASDPVCVNDIDQKNEDIKPKSCAKAKATGNVNHFHYSLLTLRCQTLLIMHE